MAFTPSIGPFQVFSVQIVGDKAVNAEAKATLCDVEEPVCERMQDRHREREIGTKNTIYSNSKS